tara:strand:+ start:860 stop:1843 length:984 start_codon:yes stop_codon:yes gene_type:complete
MENKQLLKEPLLTKSNNRYVIFPIKHDDIWKKYKDAVSTFWTPEELNLNNDRKDWEDKLNDDERYFIKNILAFFAGSDGIVMENLSQRFMSDTDISEIIAFYSYQMFIENVHGETYSLLIDTYIKDNEEKNKLFDAINTIPCVKKKAEWAQKWISSDSANFALRLIAFAIVEGVFFSGSFCAIFWLKKRGLMPGLTFSNELISRDEGMHTDFAVLLYSKIINKIPEDIVHSVFKEAINIEKEFIISSIPCKMIGMNSDMMSQYIEYVGDRLLNQLGYNKLYNVNNPFSFMELISLRPKGNFFEVRVSEYQKANVGKKKEEFSLGDDF